MTDHPDHRGLRESLGAYALGHLSPAEEYDMRVHLTGCPTCRAELEELAAAVSALALVRGPVPDPVMPPLGLGQQIEDLIKGEEHRSGMNGTARTALVSALGAAAATAAVVIGLNLAAADPQPRVPLEAVQIVETADIEATADLIDHTWGVEVQLTATGLQPGGRYEVVVLGEDGAEYPAGAFVGTDGEVRCNLNAAVLRDEAVGFIVRDQGGGQVLSSDFSA
ncbi:zf-HC2 domain-containing protein [Arthrobacter sp. HLT1-21]